MIWAALAVSLLPHKLRVSSKTAGGAAHIQGKEAPVLLPSAAVLFPDLLPMFRAKKWCVIVNSKCIPSDVEGTFSICVLKAALKTETLMESPLQENVHY